MNLNAKDHSLYTVIAVLATPWLTNVGVPPSSPAFPILIGGVVGGLPFVLHAAASICRAIANRYLTPAPAADAQAQQLTLLLQELEKRGVIPAAKAAAPAPGGPTP